MLRSPLLSGCAPSLMPAISWNTNTVRSPSRKVKSRIRTRPARQAGTTRRSAADTNSSPRIATTVAIVPALEPGIRENSATVSALVKAVSVAAARML